MIVPVVPGLVPTRPSMTWLLTAELLLSWMNAVSVDEMSPGIAATSVPPSFGVAAVDALGAVLAAALGAGAVLAAVLGAVLAAVLGAVVALEPPHAETMITVAATSAPIRVRDMLPPPPCRVRRQSRQTDGPAPVARR
jgi:hypothetical protein